MIEVKKIEKYEDVWYAAVDPGKVPAGMVRGGCNIGSDHYPALSNSRPRGNDYLKGPNVQYAGGCCWVRLQDLTPVPILDISEHEGVQYAVVATGDVPAGVKRSINGTDVKELRETLRYQPLVSGPHAGGGQWPCHVLLSDLIGAAAPLASKTVSADDQVLLDRYTGLQREHSKLSAADKARASELWSAALRAKIAASKAEDERRERTQVQIDIDPEDL